jgi:hypothetical protein
MDWIWHIAGSIVGWLMGLINNEPNRLAVDVRQLTVAVAAPVPRYYSWTVRG